MTPEAAETLQQHIGRAEAGDKKVRVDVERLLKNLCSDENAAAFVTYLRVLAERFNPAAFVVLPISLPGA